MRIKLPDPFIARLIVGTYTDPELTEIDRLSVMLELYYKKSKIPSDIERAIQELKDALPAILEIANAEDGTA